MLKEFLFLSMIALSALATDKIRITYPENSVYYVNSHVKIITDLEIPSNNISRVEFFATIASLGERRLIGTVTNSPYNLVWQHDGPENVEVRLQVKAFDIQGTVFSSEEVSIFFAQDPTPPRVVIQEPKDGFVFNPTDAVEIVVKLSPADDLSGEVQIYHNSALVGESQDPPYTFQLHGLTPGLHEFYALGRTDIIEFWSTSSVVKIWIGTNLPPAVKITYPYEGTNIYSCPGWVKLIAEASDPEGNLNRVEFFADGINIGTVTNSPFTLDWMIADCEFGGPAIPFTAKAYDSMTFSESDPVTIMPTPSVSFPVIEVLQPTNAVIFTSAQSIFVKVHLDVTSDDGSSRVRLLLGTNEIAFSNEPPYEFLIQPLSPGDYTLKVLAINSFEGEWTESEEVQFVVEEQPRISGVRVSGNSLILNVEGLSPENCYCLEESLAFLEWNCIETKTVSLGTEVFTTPLQSNEPRFFRIKRVPCPE